MGGGLNGVKNRGALRQDADCRSRSRNGAGGLNELAPVDVQLLVGDFRASISAGRLISMALASYPEPPL